MLILSTQERKYQTKTFNENFAKKVRTCQFAVAQKREALIDSLQPTTATSAAKKINYTLYSSQNTSFPPKNNY
jgi:hypothetical protein